MILSTNRSFGSLASAVVCHIPGIGGLFTELVGAHTSHSLTDVIHRKRYGFWGAVVIYCFITILGGGVSALEITLFPL